MFTMGDRTFRNRAEALRWISVNREFAGWHHAVEDLYMTTNGNDGGYCHYYWHYGFDMTFDQYQALAKVQQRYASFVHFIREIDAQWEDVPGTTVYWMDNSTTVEQRNRHGQVRTRQIVAPHGDLC